MLRVSSLVASRRLAGLQSGQSLQTTAAQPTGDRRTGELEHKSDLRARAALSAQSQDRLELCVGEFSGNPMRPARPVGKAAEPLGAEPTEPSVGLPLAQTDGLSGLVDRDTLRHPPHQQLSTCRTASGILVDVHSRLPGKPRFRHPSASPKRLGWTTYA